MWLLLIFSLDLGNWRLCTPSPALGCILPTVATVEAVARMQPSESNVSLRPSGLDMWLTPFRPLCKLLRFWWAGAELYLSHSWSSLVYKFPCVLKLPPANPEWSAFSFHRSLPSVYRGQFQVSPGEAPSLRPTEGCLHVLYYNSFQYITQCRRKG